MQKFTDYFLSQTHVAMDNNNNAAMYLQSSTYRKKYNFLSKQEAWKEETYREPCNRGGTYTFCDTWLKPLRLLSLWSAYSNASSPVSATT